MAARIRPGQIDPLALAQQHDSVGAADVLHTLLCDHQRIGVNSRLNWLNWGAQLGLQLGLGAIGVGQAIGVGPS